MENIAQINCEATVNSSLLETRKCKCMDLWIYSLFVSAPECLSIKNGDSPYSGKVCIVFQMLSSKTKVL